MRGNNKGRIFMSLINHILCLLPGCLHPSCLLSLPPSHFKSHSLYHSTDPSDERRKSRDRKRKKKIGLRFYLFIYLAVYPSCCFMTAYTGWRTRIQNRICIVGRLFASVHEIKSYMGQDNVAEVKCINIYLTSHLPDTATWRERGRCWWRSSAAPRSANTFLKGNLTTRWSAWRKRAHSYFLTMLILR